MPTLNLDSLRNGLPTLTAEWGCFLSTSALFCLRQNNHDKGVELRQLRSFCDEIQITWEVEQDPRARYSFGDPDEATEYGATGIAILLATSLTSHNTVERSCKGTGFDYWLGDSDGTDELPFQRKARLEISGILNGDRNIVASRTEKKLKQTRVSDSSDLKAYITVIEFGNPMASYEVRDNHGRD